MEVRFLRPFVYLPAEGAPVRTIPQNAVGKVVRTVEEQKCHHVLVAGEPTYVEALFIEIEPVDSCSTVG